MCPRSSGVCPCSGTSSHSPLVGERGPRGRSCVAQPWSLWSLSFLELRIYRNIALGCCWEREGRQRLTHTATSVPTPHPRATWPHMLTPTLSAFMQALTPTHAHTHTHPVYPHAHAFPHSHPHRHCVHTHVLAHAHALWRGPCLRAPFAASGWAWASSSLHSSRAQPAAFGASLGSVFPHVLPGRRSPLHWHKQQTGCLAQGLVSPSHV